MNMACDNYRPDHNGECLNCDEDESAHDLPALSDAVVDAFLKTQPDADPEVVARVRARFEAFIKAGRWRFKRDE